MRSLIALTVVLSISAIAAAYDQTITATDDTFLHESYYAGGWTLVGGEWVPGEPYKLGFPVIPNEIQVMNGIGPGYDQPDPDANNPQSSWLIGYEFSNYESVGVVQFDISAFPGRRRIDGQ